MGQTGPVTSLVRKPRTADREDFSTSSPVRIQHSPACQKLSWKLETRVSCCKFLVIYRTCIDRKVEQGLKKENACLIEIKVLKIFKWSEFMKNIYHVYFINIFIVVLRNVQVCIFSNVSHTGPIITRYFRVILHQSNKNIMINLLKILCTNNTSKKPPVLSVKAYLLRIPPQITAG